MMQNGRAVRDFVVRAVCISIVSLAISTVHAEDIGNTPPSSPGAGPSDRAQPRSEAAEAWDAVKDTTNPALLEAYVQRYRSTFFAVLAAARISDLKAAAAKASQSDAARAVPTYRVGPNQPVTPMPADGVREGAVLYDEVLSNPTGRQYAGSVVWRIEPVKTAGKADEPAVRADIDVPSRGLRMTMTFKRNLDPTLPASHIAELTFQLAADFDGGGISNVPGLLMKINEKARGVPLAGLSVKVAGGFFLVGLSNVATDRERNRSLLLDREWIDIPIVYNNQRRAILAIDKGVSGEQVFKTAFTAWGQYLDAAQPAAAGPGGNGDSR
jgi:hypothetical protein